MSLSDWCDVAWTIASRPPPGLGDPFEYQEKIYQIIFDGEVTPEMRKAASEAKVKRAKASLGKPAPRAAHDELASVQARARELALERGLTPKAPRTAD